MIYNTEGESGFFSLSPLVGTRLAYHLASQLHHPHRSPMGLSIKPCGGQSRGGWALPLPLLPSHNAEPYPPSLLLLLSRFSCVRLSLPRPWDSPGKNTGVGCHFLLQCMKVKSEREVAQSCPTLRDPMDHSLPSSSVRGIFQARVLEWGATAFSILLPYTPRKENQRKGRKAGDAPKADVMSSRSGVTGPWIPAPGIGTASPLIATP